MGTPLVGVNSVEDLRAYRFASAAEMGLDTINQVMARDLEMANAAQLDAIRLVAEPLTEQSRVYGTSYSLPLVKSDEFGEGQAKKASVGSTVSFPLDRFTRP